MKQFILNFILCGIFYNFVLAFTILFPLIIINFGNHYGLFYLALFLFNVSLGIVSIFQYNSMKKK